MFLLGKTRRLKNLEDLEDLEDLTSALRCTRSNMAASVAMAAISTPKTSTAWHPAPGGTWWHLVAGGDLRDASDVGCRM